MVPCSNCGWQNHDNAQKCANCFQVLRGGGQSMNQGPVGQPQQPQRPQQPYGQPAQAPRPHGAPGAVHAPPGPGRPGQPQPRMQYFDYIGFWPRVGAAFVDGLLGAFVFVIMAAVVGVGIFNPQVLQDPAAMEEMMAKIPTLQGFYLLLYVAYETGMVAGCGGTAGKLALGMKVVKTDGSPVAFGTALGRALFKLIISFVPCGFLSYITVATNPTHQGWYDKVINTMVVRK